MRTNTERAPCARDFHFVKIIYADRSIQKALAENRIIQDDINLIREFVAEIQTSQDIGLLRTNKITYTLVNWRRWMPPYRTATMGDIHLAISTLKIAKNKKGTPFKQNTIHDYVLFLKRFYLWMIENGYSSVPLVKIQKIRPPRIDTNTKQPDQLLSQQEVKILIDACQNSRDRALIAVMYESGCRIGELGRLTWRRVKIDELGVVLSVEDTKCGTERYVRLVISLPYLSMWRNDYRDTPEGDAHVFVTNRGNALTHGTVMSLLKRLQEKAGIEKHITPHIFRHSRITHLINQGMNESIIKLMMWGNINTDMFATYAHICGKDIDKEVLKQYGIVQTDQQETPVLKPAQCPSCMTINVPNAKFCSTCGRDIPEG